MKRSSKKRAPAQDQRLLVFADHARLAGMPHEELYARVIAAGADSPDRSFVIARYSLAFVAIALRAVGLEGAAKDCDEWQTATNGNGTAQARVELAKRVPSLNARFWSIYDREQKRKAEIRAEGPSDPCGYISPEEVERRLDVEFGAEHRAWKADERSTKLARCAVDAPAQAFAWIEEVKGCDAETVEHRQRDSAKSTSSAAYCAFELDAVNALALLRQMFDAVGGVYAPASEKPRGGEDGEVREGPPRGSSGAGASALGGNHGS